MSFLFPAFLVGALTVTIPIILHLLKRERAPRLAFSDIRFLLRLPALQRRRRRLRELLLLALRVAALLLLTLAFARPLLDATGDRRSVTVVAVDRSLSMSAPGQFERAQALARDAVSGAPADHLVAVVAFDDRGTVVQAATATRAAAEQAIARLEPAAGATRYAAGLSAAAEAMGGRGGRVVVVTDLQQAGWNDEPRGRLPANAAVEVAPVPAVEGNLAVTAVESSAAGLSARLLNTSTAARDVAVSLVIDDAPVSARSVTLAPGPNDIRFDRVPDVGVAAVRVADVGGYRWDDTRYALLDPPDPVVVLVVANGGRLGPSAFYLERALLAGANARPFALRAVAPNGVAAVDEATWETAGVVVVVGTDGLDRRGRARLASFVEAGGGVLIVTGPGVDPAVIADALGESTRLSVVFDEPAANRRLAATDARHPIFRPFGDLVGALGQVEFDRTTRIANGAGSSLVPRVLARFDHGEPALVEYEIGTGRALIFASDLNNEWNDFPRRPTFVPFVHEVVGYLAGDRERTRDLVPAEVPSGVPPRPGVATIPGSDRRVVVNVDPRESEPTTDTIDRFVESVEQRPGDDLDVVTVTDDRSRQEAEQSYWWYALLAMAVALVAEAWVGRAMA